MMAIIKFLILCALVWCYDVTGMTIDQVLEAASNASGVGVQRTDSQEGDVVTVELDMKYTREEYQALRNSRHRRGKRQAVRLETKKWTNKTVPYKMFFFTFNSEEMQAIYNTIDEAMDEWSNYTCINFRPATRADDNYVIFRDGDSCSSYVGMKTGIQDIELYRTCRQKQVVVHEIGHALGLHHHHMRPDRDDYVTINQSNIRPGFLSEFEKKTEREVTIYGEPYDYLSVMHYGSKFFSYNQRPTMIAKDERFKDLIGNSPGASFSDIKLVNYMYHCNEHCPPKSCPGKGFVGKDCGCWCPGNVTEHAAGRPVVKCTVASIEPCLIPGDPEDCPPKSCPGEGFVGKDCECWCRGNGGNAGDSLEYHNGYQFPTL